MLTLIVLFTAAACAQLIGWILIGNGSRRALERQRDAEKASGLPISVVVAVRNGEDSLPDLFRGLRAQIAGEDEIIVVDDHSGDETAAVVASAAQSDPHIRLIESKGAGKKAALTEGIETASNDALAFTDADCVPEPDWLSEIRRIHGELAECVITGYGPYRPGKGLLNRVVRFETLQTALLSVTAIAYGKPYMAVGRNLSYRKETFRRVRGFEKTADMLSGDDDLFVQSAAEHGVPVRFMSRATAFVYTDAPQNLRSWLLQKRRHLSAARRYRPGPKAGLFIYHVSALMCWLAPLALGWIGLPLLLCRLAPGQFVTARAASLLRESGLTLYFAPLDLAYQLYLIAVAPIGWFRPPGRW